MRMIYLAFSLLSFSAFGQVKVHTVPAATLKKSLAAQLNFFATSEKDWSKVLSKREGTRGGGSFALLGAAGYSEELELARKISVEEFTSVDWATLPSSDFRTRLESALQRDPVRIIENIDVHLQEQCAFEGHRSPVLLADDYSSICIETNNDDSAFDSIWKNLWAGLLGGDAFQVYLKGIHAPNLAPSQLEQIVAEFHVSLPESHLPELKKCTLYSNDGSRSKMRPQSISPPFETRYHPNGLTLVKMVDGYAACI